MRWCATPSAPRSGRAEESLEAFAAAFATLVRRLPSAPAKFRDTNRHTYKIHCLLVEMPQWIRANQASLLRISEQAFETLHHAYLEFSANFKIPKTGPLLRSGGRSKEVESAVGSVPGPLTGTRSGATAARRKVAAAKRSSRALSLVSVTEAEGPQIDHAHSCDTGHSVRRRWPLVRFSKKCKSMRLKRSSVQWSRLTAPDYLVVCLQVFVSLLATTGRQAISRRHLRGICLRR